MVTTTGVVVRVVVTLAEVVVRVEVTRVVVCWLPPQVKGRYFALLNPTSYNEWPGEQKEVSYWTWNCV